MRRMAVIDIGSNAIRCLVAQGSSYDHARILFEERIPLRLGEDAFLSGCISEKSRLKLLKVFIDWKLKFLDMDVSFVRAVATSALRNSKNKKEVIAAVFKATGILIESISGQEEGLLLKNILHYRLPHLTPQSLSMDIGGGSVEYSFGSVIKSLPLGTVRMLEEIPSRSEGDFRLFFRPQLLRLKNSLENQPNMNYLLGTGGNMKSLSRLAHRLHLTSSKREFSEPALAKIVRKLFSMNFEERQRLLKLSQDRADVILPAACLVDETCRIFGLSRILAPQVGLKEALLLDSFSRFKA